MMITVLMLIGATLFAGLGGFYLAMPFDWLTILGLDDSALAVPSFLFAVHKAAIGWK